MTVALYTLGGLAAGAMASMLRRNISAVRGPIATT
jgi:hypothetical protein